MKYSILVTLRNGLQWKQAAPSVNELQRLAANLRAVSYSITDRAGREVYRHG